MNTKYKGVIWSIILTNLCKPLSYCNIMFIEPLFCSTQHWVPIIIFTFSKMEMSLKLLYCRDLFYNLLQCMYCSIYYFTVCIVMYTSILYNRAQTNNNCCSIHIKSTLKHYPSTTHILENFSLFSDQSERWVTMDPKTCYNSVIYK